jgi:hypothetical protein
MAVEKDVAYRFQYLWKAGNREAFFIKPTDTSPISISRDGIADNEHT